MVCLVKTTPEVSRVPSALKCLREFEIRSPINVAKTGASGVQPKTAFEASSHRSADVWRSMQVAVHEGIVSDDHL